MQKARNVGARKPAPNKAKGRKAKAKVRKAGPKPDMDPKAEPGNVEVKHDDNRNPAIPGPAKESAKDQNPDNPLGDTMPKLDGFWIKALGTVKGLQTRTQLVAFLAVVVCATATFALTLHYMRKPAGGEDTLVQLNKNIHVRNVATLKKAIDDGANKEEAEKLIKNLETCFDLFVATIQRGNSSEVSLARMDYNSLVKKPDRGGGLDLDLEDLKRYGMMLGVFPMDKCLD